jgi:hypothetical protein
MKSWGKRKKACLKMRPQFGCRLKTLLTDAQTRCEAALAGAHTRMKEASRAFEEALNQQLKTVLESTITEETLNQEMVIAAQAHRDGIQRMTAIPPDVQQQKRKQKISSWNYRLFKDEMRKEK